MNENKSHGLHYDPAGLRPRVRTARIHRSGNAWGMYIPKVLAQQLGIKGGDEVRLYIVGRVLCMQPVTQEHWTPGVVAVPAGLPRVAEG